MLMKYIATFILFSSKIYDKFIMYIMLSLFTKSAFTYKKVILGDDVYIGAGATFSSITYIRIENKVMFGPNVAII